jgi:hypothetical protein
MDAQIGLHKDIVFACGAWLFLQGYTPGMRIPQGVAPRLVHELGLIKTSVKRLTREERKMYFRYPVAFEEVTSVVLGLMIRLSWRVNKRWPDALRMWWAQHAEALVESNFLAPTVSLDRLVSAEPTDPITVHMPSTNPRGFVQKPLLH